jgi:hypothetical protein
MFIDTTLPQDAAPVAEKDFQWVKIQGAWNSKTKRKMPHGGFDEK